MGKIFSNINQTLRLLVAGVSIEHAAGYIIQKPDGSEDEAKIAPNGHFSECDPKEVCEEDGQSLICAFSCSDIEYYYLHKTHAREVLYYALLEQAQQEDPSGEFDLIEIMTQVLEKFPEKLERKKR